MFAQRPPAGVGVGVKPWSPAQHPLAKTYFLFGRKHADVNINDK